MKTITLNNEIIEYVLIKKNINSINIRIKPDLKVHITCPVNVRDSFVVQLLKESKEFILVNLEKYRYFNISYLDQNEIYIFDKLYKLVILKSEYNNLVEENNVLRFNLKNVNDKDTKKKLFEKWLNNKNTYEFEKLNTEVYNLIQGLNVPLAKIFQRKMKRCLGNCNIRKKEITLNKMLAFAPIDCVKYVIIHEYIHFIVPNHSKDFYKLVEKFDKNYKEKRKILEYAVLKEI